MNLYGFVHNNGINVVDVRGQFGFVGAAIGFAVEVGMQVTINYATGEDLWRIDVKDVLISTAVGAVAPGWLNSARKAKSALKGTQKFKQSIKRTIKVRTRRIKKAGNDALREVKELQRSLKRQIRQHNELVEEAVVSLGTQTAWQASKLAAKQIADETEKILEELGCLENDATFINEEVRTFNIYDEGVSPDDSRFSTEIRLIR